MCHLVARIALQKSLIPIGTAAYYLQSEVSNTDPLQFERVISIRHPALLYQFRLALQSLSQRSPYKPDHSSSDLS